MNRFADLHIHTIHSDGVLTPEQILIKAQKFRLSAISFTDHDTINAYLEIDNYKEKYKIEIITGIELSCHEDGREIHLLGYGIDIENPKLTEFIKTVKGKRIKRAERILDKLSDIGINLSMDYVQEKAGTAPITRPHIAKAIYEQGYVNTTKEAFNLYIGDYSPAYEPKADF
ncbi:MAG: hypothetical protein QG635_2477, partial [Bacteroidota bacterium]|nr:hypothetical protein [Bacteroidota bacterium]